MPAGPCEVGIIDHHRTETSFEGITDILVHVRRSHPTHLVIRIGIIAAPPALHASREAEIFFYTCNRVKKLIRRSRNKGRTGAEESHSLFGSGVQPSPGGGFVSIDARAHVGCQEAHRSGIVPANPHPGTETVTVLYRKLQIGKGVNLGLALHPYGAGEVVIPRNNLESHIVRTYIQFKFHHITGAMETNFQSVAVTTDGARRKTCRAHRLYQLGFIVVGAVLQYRTQRKPHSCLEALLAAGLKEQGACIPVAAERQDVIIIFKDNIPRIRQKRNRENQKGQEGKDYSHSIKVKCSQWLQESSRYRSRQL